MLPILGVLAEQGLTWLGKALFSTAKGKVKEFVKKKTGVDLDVEELSPEDIAKLKELESTHAFELKKMYFDAIRAELYHEEAMGQQEVDIIASVNATMQHEAMSDSFLQKAWRPICLLIAGVSFGLLLLSITIAIIVGPFTAHADKFKEIMMAAKGIITIPELWYFPTALGGIAAYTRGREKHKRLDLLAGKVEKDGTMIDKIKDFVQKK